MNTKQRDDRFIDVSHTVRSGMITYPGLPAPYICDFLSRVASRQKYAQGTEFQIGRIEMIANTGTYVDAPFHRYAEGKDLSQLPLTSLADLDALVVRIASSHGRAIDAQSFNNMPVKGKAVLVQTGWSRHFGTEQYGKGHPFLTKEAARYLAEEGAVLVGIDSLNIDDTGDGQRPVHTTLLGNEIPIVEHLTNLDALPDGNFRFFAVPVKVEAFGSFPVRAFAITK